MASKINSHSTQEIVSDLILKEHWLKQSDTFQPVGEETLAPFFSGEGTGAHEVKLSDLQEQVNRSYDLTVSAATDLQIPVVGSGAGGFNRRVIVLERAAFNKVAPANQKDTEKHYGYAIRLCLTVNRWQANAKVSLPFLAASAQLGTIDAQWTLQVIGLRGKAIDQAILPPTELSVETFFLAKQSLEKLVQAINDQNTVFTPQLIAEVRPSDYVNVELRRSVARSYALTCLERGRTLAEAQDRLASPDPEVQDTIRSTYEAFGGITDPSQKPSSEMRHKAAEISGRLRTDIPLLG